jgi:dTDP-4-dehydrorhamnose 3,5-epimerase-like enzyme
MIKRFYNFRLNSDARGPLVAIEALQDIPFEIKRVYYIFGTREDVRRGLHAHKKLQQVLICVHGSCTILLDNGAEREEIILNNPTQGLFVDRMIWREMYNFSSDAVLLVLASEHYNEEDYIRDYKEFKLLYEKGCIRDKQQGHCSD